MYKSKQIPVANVWFSKIGLLFGLGILLSWSTLQAQTLPSTIDPGRIEQTFDPKLLSPPTDEDEKQDLFVAEPPEGAEKIRFVLKKVEITGMSVFSKADVEQIYQPFLNTEITLDLVWRFAAQINNRYKQEGYYLSRAFVPKQEINEGVVKIEVYEGYLSEIIFPDADQINVSDIQARIANVLRERPAKITTLESFLLLLNDLPGNQFRSLIEPSIDPKNGKNASRVFISREKKEDEFKLLWDMGGSNLVGKNRVGLTYTGSFSPSRKTEISTLTASPNGKLEFLRFSHTFPVDLDKFISMSINSTSVNPGGDLKNLDIQSQSQGLDFEMLWKVMRQRNENLNLSFGITSRATRTNVLETVPLVRERVRSITGKFHYDLTQVGRRQSIDVAITKGLRVSGSSNKGDIGLSRANADPDFAIVNLDYTLAQQLSENFNLTWATSVQGATTPLFSFNEFGYGGTEYGRAFNFSQLTGDHGASTRLELRHSGYPVPNTSLRFLPYFFYDLGRVWNIKETNDVDESASSYGLGGYLFNQTGFSLNIGYALVDRVYLSNPQGAESTRSGRVLFQLDYRF